MRTIEEVIAELRKDIHSDVYLGKKTIGTYLDEILEIHNTEKTGWIPVSERLPNHDEYIENNGLFNVSDGNRSYSEWFDVYDTQMFGEPTKYGFRIDHAVTAWMPLPKPYEPQESDDKCKKCKYYLNPDYTRCHECKAESEELSCCTKK